MNECQSASHLGSAKVFVASAGGLLLSKCQGMGRRTRVSIESMEECGPQVH
jgi:hypothetical protein